MTLGSTTLARVATTRVTRCADGRRWSRSTPTTTPTTPAAAATPTTRVRVRTRAAFDAQHVMDLANAFDAVNLDVTLSDAEEALGKAAFASLSVASTIFAGKVRREGNDSVDAGLFRSPRAEGYGSETRLATRNAA